MTRLPVDRRPSTWLLYPHEHPIVQPPLPERDDPTTYQEPRPFDRRERLEWLVFVLIVVAVLAMSFVGVEPPK